MQRLLRRASRNNDQARLVSGTDARQGPDAALFQVNSELSRFFVVPAHLRLIAPNSPHPASASHPAASRAPRFILHDDAINRLSFACGPEKRAFGKVRVVRFDDAIIMVPGPMPKHIMRPAVMPDQRTDHERRHRHEEKHFHLQASCQNTRRASMLRASNQKAFVKTMNDFCRVFHFSRYMSTHVAQGGC